MIRNDPTMSSITISTPNANANTLLALSGSVFHTTQIVGSGCHRPRLGSFQAPTTVCMAALMLPVRNPTNCAFTGPTWTG